MIKHFQFDNVGVIRDGDDLYMNGYLPVQVFYDGTIRMYYLCDSDGHTLEKIDPADMPKKILTLFNKMLSDA